MLTIAGGIILAVLILAYWPVLLMAALHVIAVGGVLVGVVLVVAAAFIEDPGAMAFQMTVGVFALLIGGPLCWVIYGEARWLRWRAERTRRRIQEKIERGEPLTWSDSVDVGKYAPFDQDLWRMARHTRPPEGKEPPQGGASGE